MKEKHYLIVKGKYNGEIVYIDYHKMDGFSLKPKNSIPYDGITVNKMMIVKPTMIENILKRKIKRKLDLYLQYIIALMDSSDDDDSHLRAILNDISRYRDMIRNQYQKYLEERYITLLLRKLALMEQELKMKLMYVKKNEDEVIDKENHRSR